MFIVALRVRTWRAVYNSGVRAIPLLVLLVAALQAQTARVLLDTEQGSIEVELDLRHAPLTSANFLKYVDAGAYNGGQFHRTVRRDNQPANRIRIEVIQGGTRPGGRAPGDQPIPLERTNRSGLKHLDGVISMARDTPDTATSDFFICIGDQPSLDFGGMRNPDGQGFAAFGRVVAGMNVVRKIHQAPAQEQNLNPPVKILKATRCGGVRGTCVP
ncbi:peptidylprolyl isomerase [uncultured Paludibaculum sp.]|uniref:peptidylprolyl isomerase n=1 Tax=uncultured Paludibaculum sp. TaxID=1765020 RepID=UPI002AAAB33B|nr:peptidylprolyl isomerase [uncultured Paludibaculum sp.]